MAEKLSAGEGRMRVYLPKPDGGFEERWLTIHEYLALDRRHSPTPAEKIDER
jgi:hypothetical protein